MQKNASWLLGLALLGYAVGSLALILFLAHFSLPKQDTPLLPAEPEVTDLVSSTPLPDFVSIEQTPERKKAFVDLLLPMVEQKNNYIQKNRKSLYKMKLQLAEGKPLTEKQLTKLEQLRERYRVRHETYPETARAIEILLLRADIIPSSMVLAQAAIESGWGTSRFAVEAHNLFGQWCYKPGCGLVPERRPPNATHEVQKFDSVEASVDAYYRNINTHNAYREFRQLRATLRAQDGELTGTELVEGLGKYSGRGDVYINELRTVIRVNDFENLQLSAADVEPSPMEAIPAPQ